MLPIYNLGHTFRTIYEQAQQPGPPVTPTELTTPRLVGGLWSAFKFEEAAAKYKQHLHQHYGFLHILGHNRPVPLEGVFTDVYLYDRPLAQRRLDIAQLEEQFRQRHPEQSGARRVDGLSLVRTERHLFILGQPGAGKTTFLKHVALQAAQGNLPGVPIFISLKVLADSQKPLLDFMAQEMQICGFPEPAPFLQVMLQSGQILILLDGLDEVTQAQETALNLIQSIENLIRQYSANHFLITCRTAVTDYQFPRFTTVEMSDFSLEQVDIFIHKWFQHEPSLGNNCLQELNLPEHEGLRDLASTPILLNLLCLTYEEVGHFPQRRVELYEEALSALLVKWDNSRRIRRDETYRQLSLGRKRQLLNHLAHTTFQQGQYFIPKALMVRHILDYLKRVPETGELYDDDGEAVLRAIEAQHGIIIERARGVYGFAHLTFQEYFTAKYMAEVGEKAWAFLFPYASEPRWHEVFFLTVSLLQKADNFFHYFTAYLSKLIADDPQLLALLTWVNQKAYRTDITPQLPQRALYMHLALVRSDAYFYLKSYEEDEPKGILTYGYPHVFGKADSLIHAIVAIVNDDDLDDVNAIDLDGVRPLQHILNFPDHTDSHDWARTCAHALARVLDPLVALDFALIYGMESVWSGHAQPYIELTQELSRVQSMLPLQLVLDTLIIPSEKASGNERILFAQAIGKIASQWRQLRRLELSEVNELAMGTYLDGTLLLIKCLELVTLTDRDAILSRLLAPPPM